MKRYLMTLFSIILSCLIVSGIEAETAFTFFRADSRSFYEYAMSHGPGEAPVVQLHGDPHIENFGIWWTEEDGLKFGLIDFDETVSGPFYLDLERFAIGLILVSRERGINEEKKLLTAFFESYRARLEKGVEENRDTELRGKYNLVKKTCERAEKHSRLEFLNGYGRTFINEDGQRKFKDILNFAHIDREKIEPAINIYLESLPQQYRKDSEFYKIKDAILVKREGVGSRGTLKYRLLIEGPSPGQDDDYILELREALVSPLDRHTVPVLRICEGQKALQEITSPFLGYTKFEDRDFLVDEVYPWYSTLKTEDLKTLRDFLEMAQIGGEILGDAHSKSGLREGKIDFDEIENVVMDYSYIVELKNLSNLLSGARDRWLNSLEDRYSEEMLKKAYKDMQAYCRGYLKKNGNFKIGDMENLSQDVRYPYEVYYNDLYIEANKLKEQLFNITTPGTIANSYYERPSETNLANLKAIFDRIYQYYIGKNYSWRRYLNKYLFQKSRMEHFLKDWSWWDEGYRLSGSPQDRERAQFSYERLKKECETNNLPFAGLVNAFYLSKDLDDYYGKSGAEERLQKLRQENAYEKEAVILVHGLGEDRSSWKELPRLLAEEDIVNPGMRKFFKVYLFRFDTIEDSKSVVNFTRELSGFIREVQKREGVEKVNIIAHSLGGVLTLKYLTKNTDPDFDLRPSGDEERPLISGASLLEGFLSHRYRNNIKRIITIAPSFSGSRAANVAVEIFKKPEAWFEENVKSLDKGNVPAKGDVQVEENQIGSHVNLDSFMRLDMERPLDPANILSLPGVSRKLSVPERKELEGKEVKALTIIGVPLRTLPAGHGTFGISEDDGLVRVYSANLNHSYFMDNDLRENIGYQRGENRYISLGHYELIEITSRNHPAYKYILSFLNDRLISREDDFAIKTFGIVLRVLPEPPALELELAKDDPQFSPGTVMRDRFWNKKSGAYFEEGSFLGREAMKGVVVYRLKAPGYKTKVIYVPVTRGELTYVPHLTMERE